MVLNRIAAGREFHCSAGHFFLVLANFPTFYLILEQRIIDIKKVLSSLIVCNIMKIIGWCIKLHLPLVLMISATLYWNPLTMVRTYLPKLRAPITTDHNWLAPLFIIIINTIVIVTTIAVNFLMHKRTP